MKAFKAETQSNINQLIIENGIHLKPAQLPIHCPEKPAQPDKVIFEFLYGKLFLKFAQVGGRTWDLFDFRLFSLINAAP